MEIAYAGRMSAESACGDSAHGMAHRVIGVHGTQPVTQRTHGCEEQVNEQQAPGRIAYLGPQLIYPQAGHLGRKDVAAPHVVGRNKGEGEDHYAQSAYPVGQAAPEEQPLGHGIHIGNASGTRGGEAAHRFEESSMHVHSRYEHIRKGAKDGEHHP